MIDDSTTESTNLTPIPDVIIMRLPQYVRSLKQLQQTGVEIVSSQQLAHKLHVTSAQIRKDLSYFGRFGRQGRGYRVSILVDKLIRILHLDRNWNVCLVGVGRLGRAILEYPGLISEGFHIIAGFDTNPQLLGKTIGSVKIYAIKDLRSIMEQSNINVGIVAVPAKNAQQVIDELVNCGTKAILNYAPINAQVPSYTRIRNIDPVLALQSMTFYLTQS